MSTSFNRILSPVGTTIFTHMICCLFYCWNITFEMLLHDLSSSFFFYLNEGTNNMPYSFLCTGIECDKNIFDVTLL